MLKKGNNANNARAPAHLFWNQEKRAFFDAFWIDRSQKHGEKNRYRSHSVSIKGPFFEKTGTMRERSAFSVRSVQKSCNTEKMPL